jgi:hypothetical protein
MFPPSHSILVAGPIQATIPRSVSSEFPLFSYRVCSHSPSHNNPSKGQVFLSLFSILLFVCQGYSPVHLLMCVCVYIYIYIYICHFSSSSTYFSALKDGHSRFNQNIGNATRQHCATSWNTVTFISSVGLMPTKLIAPFVDLHRLCGLVVRVPGSRTEMYCVSCEVRTLFIYILCRRK